MEWYKGFASHTATTSDYCMNAYHDVHGIICPGFILQHLGNDYCKHGWSLTLVMFLYEALGHLTCALYVNTHSSPCTHMQEEANHKPEPE